MSSPSPPAPPPDPDAEGERAPAPRPSGWQPWMAPVGLGVFFLIANLGGAIVFTIGGGVGDDAPPGVTIAATLWQGLVFVGVAVAFARAAGLASGLGLGLRGTRLGPAVGWSLAAYVTMLVATVVLITAFGAQGERDDVLESLGIDRGVGAVVAIAFLVCVVAPIAEELFFRGFFFGALRSRLSLWPAALVSGATFGGVHVFNFIGGEASWRLATASVLGLSVFGTLLCLLYARTGSLYPCIALHAINNSLALAVRQGWTWELPVTAVLALVACAAIVAPFHARRPAAATA